MCDKVIEGVRKIKKCVETIISFLFDEEFILCDDERGPL